MVPWPGELEEDDNDDSRHELAGWPLVIRKQSSVYAGWTVCDGLMAFGTHTS